MRAAIVPAASLSARVRAVWDSYERSVTKVQPKSSTRFLGHPSCVGTFTRADEMGWLSNARRHEQLLSPAAPAAKTASRVSAAGLRSYDDDDGDHLERRAARPTERAAREAKPRRVLADGPFDVPGPMLSPERTKARMTTTKTSRSLEDENASLRDELARAREDLMAERARADALASRLEAVEMMAQTKAVVVPPAMARDGGDARHLVGAGRGARRAPMESVWHASDEGRGRDGRRRGGSSRRAEALRERRGGTGKRQQRHAGKEQALVRSVRATGRLGQGGQGAVAHGGQDDPDTGAIRWARTRRDAPATAEMPGAARGGFVRDS